MSEARQSMGKVLVMSFDIQDFDRNREYKSPHRTWRQLVPSSPGGFQWRYWLRTYEPEKLFSTAVGLFELLADEQFVTLSEIVKCAPICTNSDAYLSRRQTRTLLHRHNSALRRP